MSPKRKIKRGAKATAAAKKKKSKTPSERDPTRRRFPTGVQKSGKKYWSAIGWGGKRRYIATFDTPEQASAAYMSVKKDLDAFNVSALGANEADSVFDSAKKKAVEVMGGYVPEERDLPTGVHKLLSGKYKSDMWWGGKCRAIARFDTPEQASAARVSVKKYLDAFNASALGADEASALFYEAKTKAVPVLVVAGLRVALLQREKLEEVTRLHFRVEFDAEVPPPAERSERHMCRHPHKVILDDDTTKSGSKYTDVQEYVARAKNVTAV